MLSSAMGGQDQNNFEKDRCIGAVVQPVLDNFSKEMGISAYDGTIWSDVGHVRQKVGQRVAQNGETRSALVMAWPNLTHVCKTAAQSGERWPNRGRMSALRNACFEQVWAQLSRMNGEQLLGNVPVITLSAIIGLSNAAGITSLRPSPERLLPTQFQTTSAGGVGPVLSMPLPAPSLCPNAR